VKPAPFKYLRAETPRHAVELLHEHGDDARLLAGGQTLIPMMNLRLSRPKIVIDIGRLPLDRISVKRGCVSIESLTRHCQVIAHEEAASASGIIRQAIRHIGHPIVRNQGTVGGSVAHADPAAEICALAMLLDGKIDALSAKGQRTIAAADFFAGAFSTALALDEMITAIHLHPPAVPHGACFLQVSERKGDSAIAAVGAMIVIKNGVIEDARIVMSGAAPVPVRARTTERLLIGIAVDNKLIEQMGSSAAEGHDCYSDMRASAGYRKYLLNCLVGRALTEACAQAKG
jgi:CO/xanthine dehydrogenase FAD-binding subunit